MNCPAIKSQGLERWFILRAASVEVSPFDVEFSAFLQASSANYCHFLCHCPSLKGGSVMSYIPFKL